MVLCSQWTTTAGSKTCHLYQLALRTNVAITVVEAIRMTPAAADLEALLDIIGRIRIKQLKGTGMVSQGKGLNLMAVKCRRRTVSTPSRLRQMCLSRTAVLLARGILTTRRLRVWLVLIEVRTYLLSP